jgi:chromosome segregation ATPase
MDGLATRNRDLEQQRNFAAKEITALKQRLAEVDAVVSTAQAREADAKDSLRQVQHERDVLRTEVTFVEEKK